MARAIVKTTSGITANIKATHFQKNGDFIEVYCEKNLVGMFDHGSVQFIYLSNQNNKREDSL